MLVSTKGKKRKRSENTILELDDNLLCLISQFLDYDDVIRMASTCRHVREGCERTMTKIRTIVSRFVAQGCAVMDRDTLSCVLRLEDRDEDAHWAYECKGSLLSNAKAELQNQMGCYRGVGFDNRHDVDKYGSGYWTEFYVAGLCFSSPSFGNAWCFKEDRYIDDEQWEKYEREIPGFTTCDSGLTYLVSEYIVDQVVDGDVVDDVRMVRTMTYIREREKWREKEKLREEERTYGYVRREPPPPSCANDPWAHLFEEEEEEEEDLTDTEYEEGSDPSL